MALNFAKVSIKRPTFITALLAILLILGIVSYRGMSLSMYPDVEFLMASATVEYDGADPQEVEDLITRHLEDAISGVAGIKHIYSISEQSYSIVYVQFELSVNEEKALADFRDAVSRAQKDLPTTGVDTPIVQQMDVNAMPISIISLQSSSMTPKELYDFADNTLSLDLSRVGGVAQIDIVGGAIREIHVDIDRKKLFDYRLTLTGISNSIAQNSVNVPVGDITRGYLDLTFRSLGQFKNLDDISNTIINFDGNDIPVIIKDLGTVSDNVKKEQNRARISQIVDGKIETSQAVLLRVYKQSKGNDVQISDGVRQRVAELNEKYSYMSQKPHLTVISDNARGVRMNVADVRETILEGIFLAIIIVYFFLGSWRSTFITALALPNSLIGAFVFMNIFGFSINVMSLMALSLAVGLLIDDAIVVRENIFRHYQDGESPIRAAINGTNEVTMAVIATTSSVIAVFLPVAFMSGITGQFFREFGLTVVFAMLISILDALTIAPMLSAYIIKEHGGKQKSISAFKQKAVALIHKLTIDWFIKIFTAVENFYVKIIHLVLRHKLKTIFITLICFVIALASARTLKVNFMPTANWGEFYIKLEAQPGSDLDQTDRFVKQVEDVILKNPNLSMTFATVGTTKSQYNEASIYLRMIDKPTMSTEDFQNLIRKELADDLDRNGVTMSFTNTSSLSSQSQVVFQLVGDTQENLAAAEEVLMERFKKIPGFVDVKTSYQAGSPEFEINFDFSKMNKLGINSVDAGNELRSMVAGNAAAKYRERGFEYDIVVQFPDDQKDLSQYFDEIHIANVNNYLVKLSNVATSTIAAGLTQINKQDRDVYVTLEGNIAKGGSQALIEKNAFEIFNEEKSKPEYKDKWSNITIRQGDDDRSVGQMASSVGIAAAFSIIMLFLILASLYESIVLPVVIMSALPLAVIGGLLSLFITGKAIDMFTMIGLIMLMGIVAKNSILLVDYIQQKIKSGLEIDDAIISAGTIRFRPILMTTSAIVAGMLPTALGLSEMGAFRQGMGIVVIGGVISSTILTLLVVPAIFEYIYKFRLKTRRIFGRPEERMIDCTDEELTEKGL
jgi:HAE1 family hydrophobic/amphiphilic exporter-1